jgi:hypothetical protein
VASIYVGMRAARARDASYSAANRENAILQMAAARRNCCGAPALSELLCPHYPARVRWQNEGGGRNANEAIPMDEDLDNCSRERLIEEIKQLRAGIRAHRDASGHELCWHHPALWALLPEKLSPSIAVPAWPEFMRGCIGYRQSLDQQALGAPRTREEFQD